MYLDTLRNLQEELESVFGMDIFPEFSFSKKRFPALNLFEKDDTLVLKAEVAGFDKKDIDIELKDNYIKLSGKRELEACEDGFYHRQERDFGSFERVMKLPYQIDPEKVSASYENGILTIHMEKAAASKGRKVNID